MIGISLGGFKCETAVPVDARSALIKKVQDSTSGPVGSASHLPPFAIYAMVANWEHPNETPLKELMNSTGTTVADLRIPTRFERSTRHLPSTTTALLLIEASFSRATATSGTSTVSHVPLQTTLVGRYSCRGQQSV